MSANNAPLVVALRNPAPSALWMTKREAFAMVAMQGILCQAAAMNLHSPPTQLAAMVAIGYADALLAELAKDTPCAP